MAFVRELEGNVLDAPLNSVIMHACNAQGKWGAGVAEALKRRVSNCSPNRNNILLFQRIIEPYSRIPKFPLAYQEYRAQCTKIPWNHPKSQEYRHGLVGTCMITTIEGGNNHPSSRIYVASLITSYHYGYRVDPPEKILANTAKALESYKAQIQLIKEDNQRCNLDSVGNVWAVRLNSGLFKVPWEQTKAIIEVSKVQMMLITPADNAAIGRGKKRKWTEEVSEGSDTIRSLEKGTDPSDDAIEDRGNVGPDVRTDRSSDKLITDRGSQRPVLETTRPGTAEESASTSTPGRPARPQKQTQSAQLSTRGVARPVKRKTR